MSKIHKILQWYGMHPYQGEKLTEKTMKVNIGNQYIVIKRTKTKTLDLNKTFQNVYRAAKEHNLSSIIPIYYTKNQNLVVNGNKHTYYVMPWFNEKTDDSLLHTNHLYFKELAEIHRKTSFTRKIDIETLELWRSEQKGKIRKIFKTYEGWISLFEAKHFMSPSELLLCSLYRQIREVCQMTEYWYDEWSGHCKEDKEMIYSLCHGNVLPSHFLRTDQGVMLINWESAHFGDPMEDIAHFYREICHVSDVNKEDLTEGINKYSSYYPLKKSQFAALSLYLLSLESFIKHVHQYVKNKECDTEVNWVCKFQRYQFYFDNVLYMQNALKSKMLDDLDDI